MCSMALSLAGGRGERKKKLIEKL